MKGSRILSTNVGPAAAFLTATTAVVGAVGVGFAAVPFIKSWNAERAGASWPAPR